MASKSRHKKKRSLQGKRRRGVARVTTPQQPVTQTYKPAAPSAKEPAHVVVRYPEVAPELKRIGILAGVLLTALAILALVLP